MVLEIRKSNYELALLKEQLDNRQMMKELQHRLDEAEKKGLQKFHDFSDVEMIVQFLYKRKNINRKKDRSERTLVEYKKEISLFLEHLFTYGAEIGIDIDHAIEGSLFKSLQPRHMRRYQEWLDERKPFKHDKERKYSPATLARKTVILKAFFSYLHKEGYIQAPLHDGLLAATVSEEERPNRDLGPSEVVTLLNEFRSRNHIIMFTIVHVLTTTGMRNEEFCKLQVKDLKEDLILGGYYLDVIGKGEKPRQIPLKEKVVKSIKEFRKVRGLLAIEEADKSAPLFTTNTGKAYTPSYLSQYVKKEIQKLYKEQDKEVTLTPHYFRHAFAIISQRNKVAVHEIMNSLGHERLETTQIYLEKVSAKENHVIHSWKPELFGDYI